MSNYTKTTDFGAKDSLPTGDSGKIIRGTEFETEFDAISTAIATKADIAGPTFTGTLTYETISDGTISITAFVDEDDMSSNSANLVPTQQSVKAYVDAVTTELQAQDLDFQADSGGALSIDLDTETMTFTGGTGIDTSGSGNAVTFAIDSTVATLTGTQTLTNKTLTSPDVNTPDIDGGTIDGTVIGGATPAAVSATTVSATGNITVGGTVDGRDVATDGTKLDGIEAGATADQTAAEIRTLVESATDSNVFTDTDHTKLDGIEANATADQTDAEIRAAVEAATDSNVFTDADHSKLDGIEALADVTDTTNVTAAGAVMDSELTNETAVKSLDQGVATTDSPTFAGLTTTADVAFGDNDKAIFGAGSDLQIYHDGANSFISDTGTGNLILRGSSVVALQGANGENGVIVSENGAVDLRYDNSTKLDTTSTGIDVTGVITTDGMTTSADINFGDNDKAVFGAGSDLEIYHDGNDSYIVDNGTGNLRLQGVIEVADDPSSNDGRILFGDNSSARGVIHYNYILGDLLFENTWADSAGVFRFTANSVNALTVSDAGIDVTGTVTADGLTVDAALATINAPSHNADLILTEGGTNTDARIRNSNGILEIDADLNNEFANSSIMFAVDGTDKLKINNNGDISFYEDTGTTAKFFWDASAERLGIGTSSPSAGLELNLASGDGLLINSADVGTIKMKTTAGSVKNWGFAHTNLAAGDFGIYQSNSNGGDPITAGTARMYFNGTGDVGIGVSSGLSNKLSVNGDQVLLANGELKFADAGNNAVGTIRNSASAGTSQLEFVTASTERMRIDSSGKVGINTDSPSRQLEVQSSTGGNAYLSVKRDNATSTELVIGAENGNTVINSEGAIPMAFYTNAEEAMRIDSSGNLLVGTTDTVPSNNGASGDAGVAISPDGVFRAARSGNVALDINRMDSDGAIADFRKDGSTVGSIGANGGDLYLDSSGGELSIRINGATKYEFDSSQFYSKTDGQTSLGANTNRFNNLYLSGTAALTSGDRSTGGKGGALIVGGDSGSNGLTTNTRKIGLITCPSYDNTDGNMALITGDTSSASANYIYIGSAYTGYSSPTDIAFHTGSVGTIGSEAARFDSSGNLLVGTTSALAPFTLSKSNADWLAHITNTNANPRGLGIFHSTDSNSTSNWFLYCEGGGTTKRFAVRSNGGIANYQANDVNLSDERVKTDVTLLGSMWEKFKAIEIVNFKYKDQTHDDSNIGVIAQQVEKVAPEFVDVSGFDKAPEGEEPLKAIYTADLYHATIKALQEAMDRIETLEAEVTALKGD